ncbi:hypothetical protein [Haloferula sp.]|uniref:hypothetical protein n=1 Tax=Haloferula sp. TaxID=2497595 RepID=UPI00329D8C7C
MKLPVTLIALTSVAIAQDIAPKDSERDPVLSTLLEAETSAANTGPSVTVNLAPAPNLDDPETPVLVTGNPPVDVTLNEEEAPTPEEITGVRVEVEAGSSNANVDASKIKLLAPFPAKPLSSSPSGWKLIQPEDAPPFSKKVELASGSTVTLSIRPHVLVPDADGDAVFGVREPGFDPAAHYAQKDTIGAVLADSIMSLDANSDRLNEAAKRLDELLTSLPAPAPKASPISQP